MSKADSGWAFAAARSSGISPHGHSLVVLLGIALAIGIASAAARQLRRPTTAEVEAAGAAQRQPGS